MRGERLRDLLQTAERHCRAGRLRRAVIFYRKVLAHARVGEYEHELAQARLGDLHLGRGRPDLALPHLRRARTLRADEPEYALMTGRALVAVGRYDDATEELFDAVASPTHASDAFAALAHIAGERGDRSAARHLARHAADRDPAVRTLARSYADA